MSMTEVLRTEDVVSRKRRQKDIARLDAAVAAANRSTVEIADAIAECEADQVWTDDDDFKHHRATHPEMLAEFNGWPFGTWIGWRYGFKVSYAQKMLHTGRVRGVLASGTSVLEGPANESQARHLSKAMNCRYYESLDEVRDDDARDDAIRRIWSAALKANADDPGKAARAFGSFAKEDPFEPIAREYRDTTASIEQMEQRKARRLATFRQTLRGLLVAGWRDEVADIIGEEM